MFNGRCAIAWGIGLTFAGRSQTNIDRFRIERSVGSPFVGIYGTQSLNILEIIRKDPSEAGLISKDHPYFCRTYVLY